MGLHTSKLGTLTIANGGTASNILAARELSMAEAICFVNPAAYTGTVSVQGAFNEGAASGDMKSIKVGGTAVVLTAAIIDEWQLRGIEAIRANSGSSEGAERVIEVYAVLHTT